MDLNALFQFVKQNSANIVVSTTIALIFFVLGPIGLLFSGRKIRRERVRKAKEALIDLLEAAIVAGSAVDEPKLKLLYEATERETDVELAGDYTIEDWLADVILRFEKSRHLGPDQKHKYYQAVSHVLEEIRTHREKQSKPTMPRKYSEIFSELRDSVEAGAKPLALRRLDELEGMVSRRGIGGEPISNVFSLYRRLYQRSPVTFLIVSITVLVLYIAFLYQFLHKLPR